MKKIFRLLFSFNAARNSYGDTYKHTSRIYIKGGGGAGREKKLHIFKFSLRKGNKRKKFSFIFICHLRKEFFQEKKSFSEL